MMAKLGLTPAAPKATVPTLAEWWDTYLKTYTSEKADNTQAHDEFAKSVYCAMRVGDTTFRRECVWTRSGKRTS